MRISKFNQVLIVAVAIYLFFRFGIRPPIPSSLMLMFMAIALLTIFVFISSSQESWKEFLSPIVATLIEDKRRKLRLIIFIAFPLLTGFVTFMEVNPSIQAPAELRSIHPAPPNVINFRGKIIEILGRDNPFRKTGNIGEHIKEGAAIYYEYCFYCHGDALNGKGHFAFGLNPSPADFTDQGTIAQLQESYVFWRIAKGGMGLPREGAPWNSAMPAWEDTLTEEQIWKVIIYLYEAAGVFPRTWEE